MEYILSILENLDSEVQKRALAYFLEKAEQEESDD